MNDENCTLNRAAIQINRANTVLIVNLKIIQMIKKNLINFSLNSSLEEMLRIFITKKHFYLIIE